MQKDSRLCRTVGAVGQVSQDFEAALGLAAVLLGLMLLLAGLLTALQQGGRA